MARGERIVAELGRAETPAETAARKAESSRVYRSSQTTRNLIAALIATLAIVVVIIFAVPRGTPPEREPIDVAGIAERYTTAESRTFIAPETPDGWVVNAATVDGAGPRAWTIVTASEDDVEFLRVAQGLDADEAWPARVLAGADIDGSVTIDGITWDRYDIDDPSRADNISVALATRAGTDTVLIYGQASDATLEGAAQSVSDDIRTLIEENE
ncbi:hypothetical protein JOD63_000883 [Microbacterium terrae]|uniref:DUF4245 domain-containing protein n=1 Tax=Microbacterium terrae TaxID=69369 RepID=A0A0M2H0R6_9MICO|nr:DUF4245 family protein [Microbacterium terrae]KJL39976.1 hypothetical protein RS81_01796 [Microbacterium terrae]MBP1076915.1 hypothetical protein [Microbacterium terrae]GLJ99510.1 hypothetical protein GCM10017594_27080 [Microbacterium terrae]